MFNRFCRSVRTLLSDYMDNSSSDEFKDCEDILDEVVNVKNGDIEDSEELDQIEDNENFAENHETNHRLDWNEIQMSEESESYSSSLRSSMKMKDCSAKPKDVNQLLEKWGGSVGIFDDQTGQQQRLVRLSQLNDLFELKLSSLNSSDCVLLCSLINGRYPRFYTSTVNYYQRWRMRYNIFVASNALITTEEPPVKAITAADFADIPSDQLVLHIGEIHLYFDVLPKYLQPFYINSSFYSNKDPINPVPNVVLNPIVMKRISRIVNSIGYSKDIFQFKFPLNEDLFHRKTHLFDKFIERQTDLMDETVKMYRKTQQKNEKIKNLSQKQIRYRQSVRTRDQFAYDSRHMLSQEYDSNNQNNYRQKSRTEPKVSANRLVNQTMTSKTYYRKTYRQTNGFNRDNEPNMEWNGSGCQN